MDYFQSKGDELYCEDVPLAAIAKEVGTPAYVYSRATLKRHCQKFKEAFSGYDVLPCFAVKANSNIHYLKEVFGNGFGADLVSLGELQRTILAGGEPNKIVFSGVGKKLEEIQGALELGILSFNVESAFELDQIEAVAKKMGQTAQMSLRINPNIDAKTNPKIATGLYSTKFGLTEAEANHLLPRIQKSPHLNLIGLACHIGSQITELGPLREAVERMVQLSQSLMKDGFELTHLNMGGGLGIRYRHEKPPGLEEYAEVLLSAVRPTGLKLLLEPGRVVAGNTGVLLTKVIGVKQNKIKNFVVVDGAMNDLLRPSMYDSFHDIVPVVSRDGDKVGPTDFVGPICESGDFLGKDREVVLPLAGDLFTVRGCGAYAASMASQYNSRPRSAEVMVDGSGFKVIRRREQLEDLWRLELD